MSGTAIGRRFQHGQAVAEMLIASTFLLVPLLLVMTLLMKYINMAATVQQAARYAAFQRTIFMPSGSLRGATVAIRSNAQIENAVRMRFFSAGVKAIGNGQILSTSGFTALPLWKDTTNQPMVAAASVASLSLTDASSPSLPDKTIGTILKPLKGLGVGFDLNFKDLMTANISLRPKAPRGHIGSDNLATPSSLYATLLGTLVFNAHDTVLADGWSAANPANVKHQINGVLPTSIFQSVQSALNILSIGVPDLKGLQLGYVPTNTPSEVPADRLTNYTPPPPPPNLAAQKQMIKLLKNQYGAMGYSSNQTTNPDGSVTLTFVKDKNTIVQTVGTDGSSTAPVSTTKSHSSKKVPGATQDQINSMTNKGFTVTGGPTYTCRSTKGVTGICNLANLSNKKSTWYQATVISSATIMTKVTTYSGGTSTSTTTAKITVTAASGGGSDVKTVTS